MELTLSFGDGDFFMGRGGTRCDESGDVTLSSDFSIDVTVVTELVVEVLFDGFCEKLFC